MHLRLREDFQRFPGITLHVGVSGVSAQFGAAPVGPPPGVVPSAPSGIRDRPEGPQGSGPGAAIDRYRMREINSAAVEDLSSHSLADVRRLIVEARTQAFDLARDQAEAAAFGVHSRAELERRSRSLFRLFYKKRIAELDTAIAEADAEVMRLEAWKVETHIAARFETSEAARRAWGHLVRTFEALRQSVRIWDVMADRDVHKILERSSASRTVDRKPIALDFADSELLRFDGRAMRFGNANGEDILVYPGVVLMPRVDGAFALIDLREVGLAFEFQKFIEDETVPRDSEIVGETWAKVNKDGSRDLRFRDNYQLPILRYGRMVFTTSGGVLEEYQYSNAAAAAEFARAFEAYQSALAS